MIQRATQSIRYFMRTMAGFPRGPIYAFTTISGRLFHIEDHPLADYNVSTKTLNRYAASKNWKHRYAVAVNKSTSLSTLIYLCKDQNKDVAFEADKQVANRFILEELLDDVV